jgi:hypothetical protein
MHQRTSCHHRKMMVTRPRTMSSCSLSWTVWILLGMNRDCRSWIRNLKVTCLMCRKSVAAKASCRQRQMSEVLCR